MWGAPDSRDGYPVADYNNPNRYDYDSSGHRTALGEANWKASLEHGREPGSVAVPDDGKPKITFGGVVVFPTFVRGSQPAEFGVLLGRCLKEPQSQVPLAP